MVLSYAAPVLILCSDAHGSHRVADWMLVDRGGSSLLLASLLLPYLLLPLMSSSSVKMVKMVKMKLMKAWKLQRSLLGGSSL